jgi:lantibiotic modifying enzyme
MAWALLQLYEQSGAVRFRIAAETTLTYCNQALHIIDNQAAHYLAASWASGATGIGLARLYGSQYLERVNGIDTLGQWLQIIIIKGLGYHHSLGTGDLGSLEFILQVKARSGAKDYKQLLEQKTAVTWQSIKSSGPLCGVPFGLETPGLINGLAGIGYGLLRLAHPNIVPSILLLEPPAI